MRNLGGVIVCFILLVFSLPLMAQTGSPELSMPDLAADANQSVTVPVTYTANDNAISSMVFSVDFDETNLDFDPASTMGFPWPDSITVNPLISFFVFSIGITYDANDTDGELDFNFADISPPLSALPEGDLVTITFTVKDPPATTEAPVVFSTDPSASFGNTAGQSVTGVTVDGSVLINVVCNPTGTPETICNGVDDDCDTFIDEDYTATQTFCGVGVCANTGLLECQDGQLVNTCVELPQDEPTDVTCDSRDGDCDGSIDEDFTPVATTCGAGECAGNTGAEECQNGQIVDTCDPLAGATPEVCDNLDNDCDGATDENLTRPTTCGVGECAGNTGEETCTAGTWGGDTCDPLAGAVPEGPPGDQTCGDTLDNDCDGQTDLGDPDCEEVCTPAGTPETVCNGIDDDCDGRIDEDFTPQPTTCGQGECAATGETTCVEGEEGDTCTPGTPAEEVCDNLDNDCDGATDEDLTRPTTCGVGECAGNTGEETCTAGTWGGDTCDPLAGAMPEGPPGDQTCGDTLDNDCDGQTDLGDPDCEVVCTPGGTPETVCNGIDDDCDGMIDEDFTPQPTTCGQGECAATGETTCVDGEEGDTCTPGTPAEEVCDNLDNDCDGTIDNGFNVGMSCTVGSGACENTGVFVCTIDGTGTRCNVSQLPPGTEGPPGDPTCEDRIDNDCDGFTDTGDSDCVIAMGGEGCSKGYWKKEDHFDSWYGYTPDTLFSDVFDDAFPGMTLLEVLRMKGGKLNSLGRQTVAALLNADSPDVSYDLTEMEVIMMFNEVFPGTKSEYDRLKEPFEGYNEQDCPLNGMRDEDEDDRDDKDEDDHDDEDEENG